MISSIVLTTGLLLILIGFWGMLTHRNILRIIVGFSLMGTGTHIVTVAIGYVKNGTAPIIDRVLNMSEAPSRAVDPVPSALVVTAIVIGMAVTAVMLAYTIRLYDSKKTLSIDGFTESKW
jgi:multisubunit Na+/H+ antiporter MnhC subunit